MHNLLRTKEGRVSHFPAQYAPRPRYRKSSGAVEALICGAVLLVAGAVVWAVRVFR